MFYFKSLVLTGTIPHRNTRLDFTPGVHVVRGPNFCGKSVMFQLLTRIVTGEMPYAAAKRKKKTKDAQGCRLIVTTYPRKLH